MTTNTSVFSPAANLVHQHLAHLFTKPPSLLYTDSTFSQSVTIKGRTYSLKVTSQDFFNQHGSFCSPSVTAKPHVILAIQENKGFFF